jgi:hypothetical protein
VSNTGISTGSVALQYAPLSPKPVEVFTSRQVVKNPQIA